MSDFDLTPALKEALGRSGVPTPARDLHRLEEWARRQGGSDPETGAPSAMALRLFHNAVLERAARKPVSKIVGYRDFWNSRFKVTTEVLDPRPDTETLVEAALSEPFDWLLDLGTGSGCIAISLLQERPAATGVGTDISSKALAVAQDNAAELGVGDRLELIQSDWYSAVSGGFDLIVSNPPYIAADEMAALAPELAFDPRIALTDEADGLSAYRQIIAGAPAHLRGAARLVVEVGYDQGPKVAALFESAGFGAVEILPDLDGRDRVVTGQIAC